VPRLVVLLEQLLAPVPGGTGRYSRELTRALAATAPTGWTVGSAIARHADPTAAVLSVAMLLEHVGLPEAAQRVDDAVSTDLAGRAQSAGSRSTRAVGEALLTLLA